MPEEQSDAGELMATYMLLTRKIRACKSAAGTDELLIGAVC